MDIDKCRALLCVLDTGNLSGAAEKLGYTPSGISRMMASLEEETGFPLLYRSRTGIAPTEACGRLLPVIREMARLGEVYRQQAENMRGLLVGTVRIGTAYSCYYSLLGEIISAFSRKYPGVKVELQENFSTPLAGALSRHEIDLALISRREGDFDWILLAEDPLIVWVPEDFMKGEAVYPVKRLETDPFIEIFPGSESDNARFFKREHITLRVKYSALTTFSAWSMVDAGLGVTLTNSLYRNSWHGRVRTMALDVEYKVPIGIAAAKKETRSPAAEKFTEELLRHVNCKS